MNNPTTIAAERERWQKVEALYNSVMSVEVAKRSEWLERECADESIRRDVLSLIESAETEDSFLEEPALGFGLRLIERENDSLIGRRVDRYEIRSRLGQGGMGEVYLAADPRLGRLVALKVLPASITDNRERIRRFEREAQAASAISHPNVAHIYEIGEAEGRHYITMEYVKGATLRHLVRQRSLSTEQAIDIAQQVASGLAAAHRARVIHRDIKPENIIVAEDGYVKVLDFGLAKLTEDEAAKLTEDEAANPTLEKQLTSSIHTSPEMFMGTSHYMSPEQVRRQPIDKRTDLWSLGVVLYEMLTFRRPFQEQSFSQVIIAIIEKEPAFTDQDRRRIPPALQAILNKALCKRMEERYQTADELLADLRRISLNAGYGLSPSAPEAVPAAETSFTSASAAETIERDSADTSPDAVRPQTLAQRYDTVKEEAPPTGRTWPKLSTNRAIFLVVALVLVAIAGYIGVRLKRLPVLAARPINLRFERLNLAGDIDDITLSPDGKYVAAVVREEGKSIIHVSELATGSDLRITPARAEGYTSLSFSPDGTYVYYVEDHTYTGTLYRLSKFGGGQRKIADHVSTRASFSPDGKQIVFARLNKLGDPADLIVAADDGESQRVLAKRTLADTAFFFSDKHGPGPVWSPDGRTVACATHGRDVATASANIELLDPQTGAARRLTVKPWQDISQLTWLSDSSGLIAAVKEVKKSPWQLQLLTVPGGETRALTNDPNNYTAITGAADSSSFVTINAEEQSALWLIDANTDGPTVPRKVSNRNAVSEVFWNPDGTLTFVARDGTDSHLWVEDTNGGSLRQLTFDAADQFNPAVVRDQRFTLFVSGSAAGTSIFRIDGDGSNRRRLTSGPADSMPAVAPDGTWFVYRNGQGISRMSIDGGPATRLSDNKQSFSPAISPNGELVSFFASDHADSKKWYLAVIDARTLSQIARFELPDATDPFGGLHWTPSGDSLTYISSASGAANVWQQSIKGGAARQVTRFKEAEIYSFSWSPDGKKIACVRHLKVFVPMLVRVF